MGGSECPLITVNGNRLTVIGKIIALVLCIGALPFVNNARAYAQEVTNERVNELTNEGVSGDTAVAVAEIPEDAAPQDTTTAVTETKQSKWLDDYKKPVRFTYGLDVRLNAAYLWRGKYAGGPNIQASANVGYAGVYAGVWCNVGGDGWYFHQFVPELDLMVGFNRWGFQAYLLYVHTFHRGFFDLRNYEGKGNSLEVDIRYTLSSKLPISFLWATRISGADCFLNDLGLPIRAFSSYAELSYTQHFPMGFSLYGAVGITPWRSAYTAFRQGFGVTNVELQLRKDWEVHPLIGVMLMGQVTVDPSSIASDKNTIYWHPANPAKQSINVNIACGVYLR